MVSVAKVEAVCTPLHVVLDFGYYLDFSYYMDD